MNTVRCVLAALVLLVFGGGMVLAASQSGGMVQPAIEASADQSMSGGCNDCSGGDKAMTTAACSALGTCMQAVDPLVANRMPRPDSVIYPTPAERITGIEVSPEPFPPKAYILV